MHSIIDRLKQRRIVQWGLAYVAGAVALYSALDAFAEPWGVGDFQLRIAQVGLLVGFFVALTVAWYHGERGEQRVTGVELLILAGIMGLGAIGVRLVASTGPAPVATPRSQAPMRLNVTLAENINASSWVYLGTSGSGFAYVGADGQLWYRAWDADEGVPIDGTAGWGSWFLSRDGTKIAFRVGQVLSVAEMPGGLARTLVPDSTIGTFRIGTDDYVYFTRSDSTLMRIPFDGGEAEIIRPKVPGERPDMFEGLDGRDAGVMTVRTEEGDHVEALDLRSGERHLLARGSRAVVTSTGHIVFGRDDGRLYAAPFDSRRLRLTRDPVPVLDGLPINVAGLPLFNVSADGMLVHSPVDRSERATLVQVSRAGLETTIDPDWRFDPGGSLRWWSLSPDGRRVALVVMEADRGDVWLKDLPDGRFERLTRGGGNKRDPLWTEDGARVFFVSDSLGQRDIWSVAADGGEAKLEWEAQLPISQHVTTPDPRRRIVRSAPVERFGRDLFEIDMSGGQPPRELTATEANETAPALSPDGRLLAYVSDEAGVDNVYVQPYPDADGAHLRVSASSGWSPVWSKDGAELFYLAAPPEVDARPVMMSARILSDPLAIDGRAALFTLRPGYHSASGATAFDVTADGDFLLIKQRRETSTVLVVNFYAELQRLVPN